MANPAKGAAAPAKLTALQLVAASIEAASASDDQLTIDVTNIDFVKTKNNVAMKVECSNGNTLTFFAKYSDSTWLDLFIETDEDGILQLAEGVRVSEDSDNDGFYPIFPAGTQRGGVKWK
jgi:hypothetical protein